MTVIAIHPDRIGTESYSDKWAEFLSNREISVRWVDLLQPNALEQVNGCNGVLWRFTHSTELKQVAPRILFSIEQYLNIPVFPDFHTAWHYDEKISQYYLINAIEAPIPQTWLFWTKKEAIDWANTISYPKVFKLSVGAGSANVRLVDNKIETIQLIELMFNEGVYPLYFAPENDLEQQPPGSFLRRTVSLPRRLVRELKRTLVPVQQKIPRHPATTSGLWRLEKNYVYLQEFLPNNDFDTRITVIGNRAFGFQRLNRQNDFRASGSGNLRVNPELIDLRCVEIAFQISKKSRVSVYGL